MGKYMISVDMAEGFLPPIKSNDSQLLSEEYTLQCKDNNGVWRDTTGVATLVTLEEAKTQKLLFDKIFSECKDYYQIVAQRIVKVTTELVEQGGI